MFQVT